MPSLVRELETGTSARLHGEVRRPADRAGVGPGRVELLGNHTDYNGGLVMAAAIDRFTVALGRPVPGRDCQVEAINFAQSDSFDLDRLESSESGAWPNYVKGVAWAIQEAAGVPWPRASTWPSPAMCRWARGSPAPRACRRHSRSSS